LIQKGLDGSFYYKNENVLLSTVFLLLVIGIFKGLLSYFRQYILIHINHAIVRKLMVVHFNNMPHAQNRTDQYLKPALKNDLSDISKIQDGLLALLASVLSDGVVLLGLLSLSFYFSSIAFLCNLFYMLLSAGVLVARQQQSAYNSAHVKSLAANTENLLLQFKEMTIADMRNPESVWSSTFKIQLERQMAFARNMTTGVIKSALFADVCGGLCLAGVFANGSILLNNGKVSSTSFIIMLVSSYLITTLMPKILNAVPFLSDASEALIQLNNSINDPKCTN